jgi:hypothetical protein
VARLGLKLRTFLASGFLGPVGIGSERAVVETAFGPPDDFDAGSQSHHVAEIWKYGDIELHFNRDKIWLMHIDQFSGARNAPVAGSSLDLDPWVIIGGLQLEAFTDALEQSGIQHIVVVQPDLDRTLVTFASCVHVGFAGVSREHARLELISGALQRDPDGESQSARRPSTTALRRHER